MWSKFDQKFAKDWTQFDEIRHKQSKNTPKNFMSTSGIRSTFDTAAGSVTIIFIGAFSANHNNATIVTIHRLFNAQRVARGSPNFVVRRFTPGIARYCAIWKTLATQVAIDSKSAHGIGGVLIGTTVGGCYVDDACWSAYKDEFRWDWCEFGSKIDKNLTNIGILCLKMIRNICTLMKTGKCIKNWTKR